MDLGHRLVVVSYNVKGGRALRDSRHLERLATVIRELDPDVAGLQEVHRSDGRIQDQAQELAERTNLNFFFGSSLDRGTGQYGNLLLTKGTISETEVHPLPGSGEPRTLLQATVELNGLIIDAFVSHLSAWWPFGAGTRERQTAVVADRVRRSSRPFILMGDFNTTPRSAELRHFHSGDFVLSCFPEGPSTHRTLRRCLDYVFTDPHWRVESARVERRGPSDHWPLVASLRRDRRRE